MVENPSRENKDRFPLSLTVEQVQSFQHWLRVLQKALTLEVESGFNNLQGRHELFHSFISKQLLLSPFSLSGENHYRIKKFSQKFNEYPQTSLGENRRLVIDTRKFLYELSKQYSEDPIAHKIRLKTYQLNVSNRVAIKPSDKLLTLNTPVSEIKGIGLKLAERLSALGILVAGDLLTYYPRDYVDYSNLININSLEVGEAATIVGTVRRTSAFTSPKNPNLSILELYLQDKTGRIKITKFFAGRRFSNMSYLKSQQSLYPSGSTVAISGLVKEGVYGKSVSDPIIEVIENTNSQLKSKCIGRLLPVYSLTDGINSNRFRDFIEIVLPLNKSFVEPLPSSILETLPFPVKSQAIHDIHFPSDKQSLDKARRRLVFDEFFIFQLSLLFKKAQLKNKIAPTLDTSLIQESLCRSFLELLPFSLTKAQQRVLSEIESDLKKSKPMARLVQGDVGSGKTVIAIASLLSAVQAGWQGALMAPTEVLAEQHYRSLCKWLPQLNVTVELLTGSSSRSHRRRILDDLINGSLKILVGTHALIEAPVSFSRLGLVVVDEQHRFGVRQRNLLLDKGIQPHLLTMTATPIPRTLALSLYGDLDVSQIDEMPPGRATINTQLISRSCIEDAYQLIREVTSLGQQAYVVLPLVEESEKLELSSAKKVYKEFSLDIFPELKVGLLHGRMTGIEKQSVIQKFRSIEFNILVSTTVIEVGVDVPNATVMLIDNAERFGLAQLHQLRGRVGRGISQSHCLLIYDGNNSQSKQRLNVLAQSNDGFEISEIDLRLRGPGQVLGTRQSGLPDFALANLIDDTEILELARKKALQVLEEDPELINYSNLRKLVEAHRKSITLNSHLN